jgi:hypothetical protein
MKTLTDQAFILAIKANPAYRGIDIDVELWKMDAWLLTKPGRQKTRAFIVNWLNKIGGARARPAGGRLGGVPLFRAPGVPRSAGGHAPPDDPGPAGGDHRGAGRKLGLGLSAARKTILAS